MKETATLEKLLNQLTEFYHQILANQDKNLSVSPETLEAINQISKIIDDIARNTETEAKRMGISQEVIRKTILEHKDSIPADIKNILDKSQELKCQLEGCRNVLKDAMKKQKEEKNKNEKRKDKFKKIGSKKGWIPL